MDSGSTKECNMAISESTLITVSLKNNSDKKDSLKNADVEYIKDTKGQHIFYVGGIHVGSKLDDLTSKWGQPSNEDRYAKSDEMKYHYSDYDLKDSSDHRSLTGNEYIVTISRNTSIVTDIEYKWSQSYISDDVDKLTTVSTEFTSHKDNKKTELLISLPTTFVQQGEFAGSKSAIFMVDNVPYIVEPKTSPLALGNSYKTFEEVIKKEFEEGVLVKDNQKHEILSKTDTDLYGYKYNVEKNTLWFELNYINKKSKYSYQFNITPYDPNGTITDSTIEKFKDIVAKSTLSIHKSNPS